MTSKPNTTKERSKDIKVTFNGEAVGYVLVDHTLIEPSEGDEWCEFTNIIVSDEIKEKIQKGDLEYKTVNELVFQLNDTCLIYQAKDNEGIVKQEIIPLSHVQRIKTGRTLVRYDTFSEEEKMNGK